MIHNKKRELANREGVDCIRLDQNGSGRSTQIPPTPLEQDAQTGQKQLLQPQHPQQLQQTHQPLISPPHNSH